MDMPVVAASRFKGDVRQTYGALAGLCQRVQIGIADEKLGKGGIGLPLTENILLVKHGFVLNLHNASSLQINE